MALIGLILFIGEEFGRPALVRRRGPPGADDGRALLVANRRKRAFPAWSADCVLWYFRVIRSRRMGGQRHWTFCPRSLYAYFGWATKNDRVQRENGMASADKPSNCRRHAAHSGADDRKQSVAGAFAGNADPRVSRAS